MIVSICFNRKFIQKSILAYSYYCNNKNKNNENNNNLVVLDYNELDHSIELCIDENEFNIKYNNENINIKIEYYGDYLSVSHTIHRYKKVILEGNLLNEFILDSIKYYETICQKKMRTDKINILIFDFSWTLSNYSNFRSIDTISLPTDVIKGLTDDIDTFINNKPRFEQLNIPYSKIYMLYGPPGTGKTTTIKGVASKYKYNIALLEINKDLDDKALRRAFKKVPKNTLLVLEDFDCLFENRKANDDLKNNSLTFSGILNVLDGIDTNEGLIIFLTTNNLEILDSAIKRRIDYFIKFDYSTKSQIKHIFNRFFEDYSSEFEKFYSNIKSPVTINILQKFFIKNLNKNIIEKGEEFNEYCKSELALFAKNQSMYT